MNIVNIPGFTAEVYGEATRRARHLRAGLLPLFPMH
ncbi:MAG: hypothetical protein OJF51_000332 [Nitrospira sp.]|nr:MAG: hypothetical protein OJF51_000332 [Nitrospira sp.]